MVLPVQAALLLDSVLEGEALVRVELGIPAPMFANKPVLFDLLKIGQVHYAYDMEING